METRLSAIRAIVARVMIAWHRYEKSRSLVRQ
jgi:hypothetical protein